jgi:hypothetical protein
VLVPPFLQVCQASEMTLITGWKVPLRGLKKSSADVSRFCRHGGKAEDSRTERKGRLGGLTQAVENGHIEKDNI